MLEIFDLIRRTYSTHNLWWHIAAFAVTYVFVVTGLDWNYFLLMYTYVPFWLLIVADITGFFVPILLPIGLILAWKIKKNRRYLKDAWVLVKTICAAFLIALFYKCLAGRTSPPHEGPFDVDISTMFHFGFMREQVIGGWPSSHATIAFAMAGVMCALYPNSKVIKYGSYVYAAFIAFGVAIGFHWLSEVISGMLFGLMIGHTTSKNSPLKLSPSVTTK